MLIYDRAESRWNKEGAKFHKNEYNEIIKLFALKKGGGFLLLNHINYC